MAPETAYVPTPPRVADFMATSVFGVDRPTSADTVLYPGLGTGNLFEAVRRYCTRGEGYVSRFEYDMPRSVAYEIDSSLVAEFTDTHPGASIEIHHEDFLTGNFNRTVDYVLANPPYIHYNDL